MGGGRPPAGAGGLQPPIDMEMGGLGGGEGGGVGGEAGRAGMGVGIGGGDRVGDQDVEKNNKYDLPATYQLPKCTAWLEEYRQWCDGQQAWECTTSLYQPTACTNSVARGHWLFMADFFKALKHGFQDWLGRQRRTGRSLAAWAAEEAFGPLGEQAQDWVDKGLVVRSPWDRWRTVNSCKGGSCASSRDGSPCVCLDAPRFFWRILLPVVGRTFQRRHQELILSWNVGPHGYDNSIQEIDQILSEGRAIVCLQDLRIPPKRVEAIKKDIESRFNYQCFVTTTRSDNTDTTGRGYLFTTLTAFHKSILHGASSDELDFKKQSKGLLKGRALCVKAKLSSGKEIYVVNIYQFTAGAGDKQKLLWDVLFDWVKRRGGSKIVLIGDFNCTLLDPDTLPGRVCRCRDECGCNRHGYTLPLMKSIQRADEHLSAFVKDSKGTLLSPLTHTWKRVDKGAILDHAVLWGIDSDAPPTVRWPRAVGKKYDHGQLLLHIDNTLLPSPALTRQVEQKCTQVRIDPVAFKRYRDIFTARSHRTVSSSTKPNHQSWPGEWLYQSYRREGESMKAICTDIQHKQMKARKRAKERPTDRCKDQQQLRKTLHLLTTALYDASHAGPNTNLSLASRTSMKLMGVTSDLTVGQAKWVRASDVWRRSLTRKIKLLQSKITAINRKNRHESLRQISNQHRWLFDNGVKGMRRVMGKFGTSVKLEAVRRGQPTGIRWEKVRQSAQNLSPVLARQTTLTWFEGLGLDPFTTSLLDEPDSVTVSVTSLHSLSPLLHTTKDNGPQIATSKPKLTYGDGPWTAENVMTAAESFFQRNAYNPFATCPQCQGVEPEPITRRRETDICEHRVIEHFCPNCMDFVDFRHNRTSVKDMSFMDDDNVFGYYTIPSGSTLKGIVQSFREFASFIKRMPQRRSPGLDGLPAEIIRNAPEAFQERLHELVNQVLTSKYKLEPDALMSKVVLLYKKGMPDLLQNYRPVALLNTVYQLANLVIESRLKVLTERHCVQQSSQFGFRHMRGVALSAQKQQWLFKQARKTGGFLIRIDLDCTNAFNSAGHENLWKILERFGVPDIDLIQDLYEHSSMVLSIDGKLSASISMDTGTAQGSTLSPLLFNLFINVLLRSLDATGITHSVQGAPGFNNLGFADDLSLYVGNERDGNALLAAVKRFEDWSGLRISIAKSFVTGALTQTGAGRRRAESKLEERKNKQAPRHASGGDGDALLAKLAFEEGEMDATSSPHGCAQIHTELRTRAMMSKSHQAPQKLICKNCQTMRPTFAFRDGGLGGTCIQCEGEWRPKGIRYGDEELKVIHGREATRFLGLHGDMYGDNSKQVSMVYRQTAEVLAFLSTSNLTTQQNLCLLGRSIPSFLRFSAGPIAWSERDLHTLSKMWLRAYKLAWSLPTSTASCIFSLPAEHGGLQVTLPLEVLTQTLWTHLERCMQYNDGTKKLAECEYQEAMSKYHCLDLGELQEEMRLHTWKESMSNSFTRACFLAAKLNIKITWYPFHPDSLGSTADEIVAEALCRGGATLRMPGSADTDRARCVGFRIPDRLLIVETAQAGRRQIPFQQSRGKGGGSDMRALVQINFPTANTLQELEEDLSIACTSSKHQNRLSWSRGTIHLRQSRMKLEGPQEGDIEEREREELNRLKEGEKAFWSILPGLIQEGYTSLDMLPREGSSNNRNVVRFRVPPTKGVNPDRRLILQDWLNERSIKQWSELQMESVRMPEMRGIDEFASVTKPSLPAITDLQLALKHLLKLPQVEARAWWDKFLAALTPSIRPEYEHFREEVLNLVEDGWESENWQEQVEKAYLKLGPLIHPRVRSKRKIQALEDRGSASAAERGCALVAEVLKHEEGSSPEETIYCCKLQVPTRERIQSLGQLGDRALMQELRKGLDLIRMPTSWWPQQRNELRKNRLNGWWVRGISIEGTKRCVSCKRYKTTHAYEIGRAQCRECRSAGKEEGAHDPGDVWQDGLLLRSALPERIEDEGDTPLIPEKIRACLKLMLQLYTQSSSGSRVRPEDKKEAKLMARAVARQDVKSAKKAKMSVDDLQGMRSGMQSFFRPSVPQQQLEQDLEEADEEVQLDWAEGWFTTAQLGFPLLEDMFERNLHPSITQYISTKQSRNATLTSLLKKWSGCEDLVECDGCGGEVGAGVWWHCTQCKDTDLCQSCHHAFLTEGKHHDTDHIFTQQNATGGVHAHNTDPGKSSDWEPYSVPHLAKDPVHVPDVELPSEDIMTLLENPPQMGVVRVFLDPVAHQLDWLDTSVIVRQGVATGTGPLGGFQIEGARWHFLRQVVAPSLQGAFVPFLLSEIKEQTAAENKEGHVSYNWTVLRAAQGLFEAKNLVGTTLLTAPPFFECAANSTTVYWGQRSGPTVFNLDDWREDEWKQLTLELETSQTWTILTQELPKSSKRRAVLEKLGSQIAVGTGKVRKWKGWWRNGTDNCASLTSPTECWISKSSHPNAERVTAIQQALASSNEKDLPAAGDSELERIYLDGSEVGLLGIHRLVREGRVLLRSGDGSTVGQDMSAGVYRAEDGEQMYVKVGRANEGTSSTRPETGALAMALSETRERRKALIYIGDSSTLLTNVAACVGEGKCKSLAQFPDGDILREVVNELHYSVQQGVPTFLIKIKSHRGEFFNEQSDRAADRGRDEEAAVMRWNRPSGRPIFSWKDSEEGPEQTSCMGPKVKQIIKTRAAYLAMSASETITYKFLMVPDSSRDLIHLFLKDGHVHEKAKKRLIQTITNQFPCQAYLHTRGMTQSPFCAACQRRNIPDQTETVGHIQCWCPALERPRIAAHHCIWRELISLIQKHSTEKTEDKLAKAWSFPTANELEAVHKEWTVQDILTHIGRDTTTIHSKIERFLERTGSPSNDTDVKAFLDKRPDGVAFDETKKKVCLLEFTRAMDAREEWEERKERDKTKRYAQILTFINDSSQGGPKWEASQINFTVGVRGTIRKDTFFSKLSNLGVSEQKNRESIRKKVGRRTLEMHDLLLKSYYQVKFNPSTEQDSFQLAKTEKQSRAVHHKLYVSLIR